MIDKEATCGRDGCLATAYTDYIGELEATIASFAAVDRARQEENAKLEATIAELREAARALLDGHERGVVKRGCIDALAALLDATLEKRVLNNALE